MRDETVDEETCGQEDDFGHRCLREAGHLGMHDDGGIQEWGGDDPPQEITCSGGLTIRKPGAGNGQ